MMMIPRVVLITRVGSLVHRFVVLHYVAAAAADEEINRGVVHQTTDRG